MEIGSFYEIDPIIVKESVKKRKLKLHLNEIEKYKKQNTVYTSSGREAIALALISMEKENPGVAKKCLMPAYMCDTVFFPFEQYGWELFFYHIDKNMEADKEDLQHKIETIRPGLLFIHAYYGVDTWKPMRPFLHTYKEKGILIMEDITQSYYLRDCDSFADYVVGSLRKWYQVADGGFLTTNHSVFTQQMVKEDYFTNERLSFLTKKWNYLKDALDLESRMQLKQEYLSKNREMEDWLDHISHISYISDLSSKMMDDISEDDCRNRRNENYRLLYSGLKNIKCVSFVVQIYDKDAAPLYFAIYAKERELLQSFLRENDIYAPVLWPISAPNAPILSETEKYIFSHLLAIPMDQRYGKEEMEKIIETIKEFDNL